MKSRDAVGYVVQVDGPEIILNLLDIHKGQLASHVQGVSSVTEIGSLLTIDAGARLLVMKVLSLSFLEPREAHRYGVGSSTHQSEPLRNVAGVIVGTLVKQDGNVHFLTDSLASPPLGAEAYPLNDEELAASLGQPADKDRAIVLGEDLRGGGRLSLGINDLVSRHVAVLGSSGQGKSCFTAAVLQQMIKLPGARIVVFDINGEYERALRLQNNPDNYIKVTTIGGGDQGFKIPYYALGRYGLHRLLIPSEKTQRPALSFALESLNKVSWFYGQNGAGLVGEAMPVLFDDCRQRGAQEAYQAIERIRNGQAQDATIWPPMAALSVLVAESYSLEMKQKGIERDAFKYSNVSPLINRIRRFMDDPMFCDVVDVSGGIGGGGRLSWASESSRLVENIFGGEDEDWRIHIVNLKRIAHDLTPFILGSLLELYASELFRRGQNNTNPTLLVLEEAHHYMRPIGSGEDALNNSLAYERLAKEGRKFGLALWISTQRPSEVSTTVLSQCNNWAVFRLTSERDLGTVQSASEWSDRRDIKRIAGLARQNAMIFGGSIKMPTIIRVLEASPRPDSDDGAFEHWFADERA